MVDIDTADTKQLVQELRTESTAYYRQLVIWLGVGSAGAATAFVTLATNLPDPNRAFFVFVPSLWSFLVGVVAAGLSILFASLSALWAGQHFADAHNREKAGQVVHSKPEVFSSPRRIADEANAERNLVKKQRDNSHKAAEYAWTRHVFWKRARNTAVALSALAFVIGMTWPIVYVSAGGKLAP